MAFLVVWLSISRVEPPNHDPKADSKRNYLTGEVREVCRRKGIAVHGGNFSTTPQTSSRKLMWGPLNQDAKNSAYQGDDKQCWLIGDHHITPHHIILIGVVHVSQGSWMPILQLNDRFTLRWGQALQLENVF